MNDLVKTQEYGSALMTREDVIGVLCSSLYPGAKRESAEMVLAYCDAAKLDAMQKPVHIVPMSVKSGRQKPNGDDIYETRDTVMPGIGLYRIQASRTGQYAGMDDPTFGPIKTLKYRKKTTEWITPQGGGSAKPKDKWEDAQIEYPEWCKIVVYRLVAGIRCPFPAVEYWIENYATAGRFSDSPNSMWERRVFAQLAKCTEAQALRKGFPEVGNQPTFEEMEGRTIQDADIIEGEFSGALKQPQSKSEQKQTTQTVDTAATVHAGAQTSANDAAPAASDKKADTVAVKATPGALKTITLKADAAGVTTEQILIHFNLKELEGIDMVKVNEILGWIKKQAQAAA